MNLMFTLRNTTCWKAILCDWCSNDCLSFMSFWRCGYNYFSLGSFFPLLFLSVLLLFLIPQIWTDKKTVIGLQNIPWTHIVKQITIADVIYTCCLSKDEHVHLICFLNIHNSVPKHFNKTETVNYCQIRVPKYSDLQLAFKCLWQHFSLEEKIV